MKKIETGAMSKYMKDEQLEIGNELSHLIQITESALKQVERWSHVDFRHGCDQHVFTTDKIIYLHISTGETNGNINLCRQTGNDKLVAAIKQILIDQLAEYKQLFKEL